MSTVSDEATSPPKRSTFEAVVEISTTAEHRTKKRSDSRSANPLPHTMPSAAAYCPAGAQASAESTSSCMCAEAADQQPPSTTSSSSPAANAVLRNCALPAQNSGSDMDGYRSSCEGSMPDDGGRGSRGSSVSAGMSSELPHLSSNALAAETDGGGGGGGGGADAQQHSALDTDAGLPGVPSHQHQQQQQNALPTRLHRQHHAHGHHRQYRPRQRSSADSLAREEERQRLMAASATEGPPASSLSATTTAAGAAAASSSSALPTSPPTPTPPLTAAAVAASAAAAASVKTELAKSSRTTVVVAPASLADASAADSDCSSTEAMSHAHEPVFASSSVNTAAAMLSLALDSEARDNAAAQKASDAAKADTGVTATSEGEPAAVSSEPPLLCVAPPPLMMAAEPPADGAAVGVVDAVAAAGASAGNSPLQGTASRLSRSSSDAAGAVEATMECSVPLLQPPPTPQLPSATAEWVSATAASMPGAAVPSMSHPHYGGLCTPVTPKPFAVVDACPAVDTVKGRNGKAKSPMPRSPTLPLHAPTALQSAERTSAARPTHVTFTPLPTSSVSAEETQRGSSPPAAAELSSGRSAAPAISFSVEQDVTHVGDMAPCVQHTATNSALPLPHKAPPAAASKDTTRLMAPNVDVSSSSSVGGHHLSVTEGNAFLKQSGSRREEAFYNMIQPYQEALVREAVRQAPHTVEHWRHQNAASAAAAASTSTSSLATAGSALRRSADGGAEVAASANGTAATTATHATAARGVTATPAAEAPPLARHGHADPQSSDAVAAATADDDVVAECDARWAAYQQYEAEDMSSLDILAAGPPTTEEEQRLFAPMAARFRAESVVANSPLAPYNTDHRYSASNSNNNNSSSSTTAPATQQQQQQQMMTTDGGSSSSATAIAPAAVAVSASTPTSPLRLVDKTLVELAARLWWTIRFRHFYRSSSAAYEVQRQAAEAVAAAAAQPPPSPSASLLGVATALPGGPGSTHGGQGWSKESVVASRCSTPVSLHRYSTSPSAAPHLRNDSMETPPQAHMPPTPPTAGALRLGAGVPAVVVSGTATPNTMGSLAAASDGPAGSGGAATAAVGGERQYAAQKHRALQLLAAFVPRYHGTRRLFVKEVLRFEKRAAAAAAAAAASSVTVTAPDGTAEPSAAAEQNPLEDATKTTTPQQQQDAEAAAVAVVPKIVDADDDDDDDDESGEGGGRGKICRMIMLEYVCYKFRRACVLDIKMGSRQYGLHPTAEKKRSKEKKAQQSTSGRYGIRLAGYRRWNAAESKYEFRSKLQCRYLTLTEVKNEISTFLLNSRELEHVFRRQLQRLRVAFSQQTVFRFYTSSLLFVYDAEDPLTTARVTMVDFAYTYESKELVQGGDPDADFAYDVGYLKAIDTLLSLLA